MKKIAALILLFAVIFTVCGCTVIVRADEYAFVSGNVHASIIPSEIKIERSAEIPKTVTKKLRFDIGRNDLGSVQFVFSDKTDAIGKTTVEISALANEKGEKLPDGCVSVFREYFHPLPTISENTYCPDALIPLEKAADTLKTEAGHNCALWFDAEVPFGTAAGLYAGSATVSFGETVFEIPVEINVLDLDIPLKSSLDTYGAVFNRLSDEYTNLSKEECDGLEADIREKLLKSRLTASTLVKGRADFGSAEEYADYIADSLEADPRITGLNINVWKDDLDYIKAVCDRLRERGVLDKCYIYSHDEPSDGMIPEINEYLDNLNELIPELKDIIPTNSYRSGMLGHLKFWCLSEVPIQNESFRKQIRDTGAVLWRYGSESGQIADNSAARTVAYFTETKDYGIDGLLIWSIYHSGSFDSYEEVYTTWNRDMWNDVYCFQPAELWDPRGGGATFFYPGKAGEGITSENVICESIRLRYLREAGEYYELLTKREEQLRTATEKLGIFSDELVHDLMSEYYTNTKNAIYTDISDINSEVLKAYNEIIETTYEDILTFDENAPLIAVCSDDDPTLFYARYVSVYAPNGATVTVDGITATETVLNEKVSKFTASANCFEAVQTLTVSVDGKTSERTVYARSVDKNEVHGIFADGGISEADYNVVAKSSGNAVIGFRDGNIRLDLREVNNVAKFNLKNLGHTNTAELENCNNIAITITNETAGFLTSMTVSVNTRFATVDIPVKFVLDPGMTKTVYVPLDSFFNKGQSIKNVTRISISNSGIYTEDFIVGISDIAFVKVD